MKDVSAVDDVILNIAVEEEQEQEEQEGDLVEDVGNLGHSYLTKGDLLELEESLTVQVHQLLEVMGKMKECVGVIPEMLHAMENIEKQLQVGGSSSCV